MHSSVLLETRQLFIFILENIVRVANLLYVCANIYNEKWECVEEVIGTSANSSQEV